MTSKGMELSPVPAPPGTRFGHLVVLSRKVEPGKYGTRAIMQCDCGATKVLNLRDLRNNHTTSCGCARSLNSAKGIRNWSAAQVAAGLHGTRYKGDDHPRLPWRFRSQLIEIDGDKCVWPACQFDGVFEEGHRRYVDHNHACCDWKTLGGSNNVACRKCVRGVVHPSCNTTIMYLEIFLRDGLVTAISAEMEAYLTRAPLAQQALTLTQPWEGDPW